MSMDLFLILAVDTPLNSNDLNVAAQKFEPVAVYEKNIDLATHTGFLPVNLDGVETGVETYKISFSELVKHLPPNDKIDPNTSLIIHFRWGGDLHEGATALYTAAVYSATYNGIAFDPMSNMYLTPEQLTQGYQALLMEAGR